MAVTVGIQCLGKAELSKNSLCILLLLLFFGGVWYIRINEIASYQLMPSFVKDQPLMMVDHHALQIFVAFGLCLVEGKEQRQNNLTR